MLPLKLPLLVEQTGAQEEEIDHDGARDDENGVEEVVIMTVNVTAMMVMVMVRREGVSLDTG